MAITTVSPTYVGLELRLRTEEAEALEIFLRKFRGLIEHRVMTCPRETREPLLTATGKLLDRLAERCPPFDAT
jgi:hypothetical protein